MRDVRRTDEVDAEDSVPVRWVDPPEGEAELSRSDARGKDHVVDRPQRSWDVEGDTPDRLVVGHVGDESDRPGRTWIREMRGNARHLGVSVDDRDPSPLGEERGGDGPAQAPSPADDDGDLSGEFEVHRDAPQAFEARPARLSPQPPRPRTSPDNNPDGSS